MKTESAVRRPVWLCRLAFVGLCIFALGTAAHAVERLIFDTDLGADCDDAGTFAMMHALADRGEIEILAVGIVNGHRNAVPAADAINTWFGRPDLPIGTIKKGEPFNTDRYLARIKAHPHDLTKEAAPDVVPLYRRVLAAQPDRSVTLVAVGPATNISHLLNSEPDEHSPLNGIELMRRKIKFYAACGNGGGGLPNGPAGWNYQQDVNAARDELAKLPTEFPTVFAGGSGTKIKVGSCYEKTDAAHIIRQCYEGYFGRSTNLGRPTWDQLRLLYAARPAIREQFTLSAPGDIAIDEKKVLTWTPRPNRNRAYAYVKDLAAMHREVEKLMMHLPQGKAQP
jgi:hypothetical protein